jgi:hypothetical protein
VNRSCRFSEDTWHQIVNFGDFPLHRIHMGVVRNFPKCRSPKLLWAIDIKGEVCTLISKGTHGRWRYIPVRNPLRRICGVCMWIQSKPKFLKEETGL